MRSKRGRPKWLLSWTHYLMINRDDASARHFRRGGRIHRRQRAGRGSLGIGVQAGSPHPHLVARTQRESAKTAGQTGWPHPNMVASTQRHAVSGCSYTHHSGLRFRQLETRRRSGPRGWQRETTPPSRKPWGETHEPGARIAGSDTGPTAPSLTNRVSRPVAVACGQP
jgi:hypothetical protein